MHSRIHISAWRRIPPIHQTHQLHQPRPGSRGFTLMEVLIATSILATIALLAWRGIDHMVRTRHITSYHSTRLLDMQTALAQWRADWDATLPDSSGLGTGQVFDWNGRTLRLLRLASPAGTADLMQSAQQAQQRQMAPSALTPGLQVVAWTRQSHCTAPAALQDDGPQASPCWLRWQSPILRTLGEQQMAWQQAASWASSDQGTAGSGTGTGTGTGTGSMVQYIAPLQDWKLAFYTQGSWVTYTPPAAPSRQPSPPPGPASPPSHHTRIPDAVRLQLELPEHAVLPGTLTLDWINPTYTRYR